MKIINPDNVPEPIGPYSHAIKVGNFLFISGQLPINAETNEIPDDIQSQTRQTLINLQTITQDSGADWNDVIKCGIFVRNMDDLGQINEVYNQFFAHHKPVRTTVEVNRLPKNVSIEIDAIVYAE